MAKVAPFFRLYQQFIEHAFGGGSKKLKQLQAGNPNFSFFCDVNQVKHTYVHIICTVHKRTHTHTNYLSLFSLFTPSYSPSSFQDASGGTRLFDLLLVLRHGDDFCLSQP